MAMSKIAMVKETWNQWSSHNASRLAAALALYTMMSLAPLLVVALTIAGFVFRGKEAAQEKLTGQASQFMGGGGGDAIHQMLQSSVQHAKGGLAWGIIAFVVAVISGSSLFASLQDALNTMWDVKPKPDVGWKVMVRNRIISAGMTLLAAIILLASVVLSAALSVVAHRMGGLLSSLSYVGDVIVSLAVVTVMFALIFKFLPDVKVEWRDVWVGAAITSVLFLVGKYLLAVYFRFGSVASPYGAFGSLAVLLIWVYYSSMLLFFGVAFTRVYAQAAGHPIQPNEYAVQMNTTDRILAGTAQPQDAQRDRSPTYIVPRYQPLPATTKASPSRSRMYLAAGAGLAVGVLGAFGLANTPERRLRREAAAMHLHGRFDRVAQRAGGAARLRELLAKLDVERRVEGLEDRIERTARYATQPPETPRGALHRVVGFVKGI